jgi:hypothetical protein
MGISSGTGDWTFGEGWCDGRETRSRLEEEADRVWSGPVGGKLPSCPWRGARVGREARMIDTRSTPVAVIVYIILRGCWRFNH